MKTTIKLNGFIALAIIALTFFACGGNDPTPEPPPLQPPFEELAEGDGGFFKWTTNFVNDGGTALKQKVQNAYNEIWNSDNDNKELISYLAKVATPITVTTNTGAASNTIDFQSASKRIRILGTPPDNQFTALFKKALEDCRDYWLSQEE